VLWAGAGCLLVVGGVAVSGLAATGVARSSADHSVQVFAQSSSEVASTLQLEIERENDLAVNAIGFITENPGASNTEFSSWINSVRVLDRYPQLSSAGLAVIVTHADLPAHIERVLADPPFGQNTNGVFEVLPPGDRPFYCLLDLAISRSPEGASPIDIDFCVPGDPSILAARDSGKSSYIPFDVGELRLLVVRAPVYRDGVVPATVEARREQFIGWFGSATVPQLFLDRALQGHPDMTVSMRFDNGTSTAEFTAGDVENAGHSVAIDLHNGWTVHTFGTVASASVWANDSALALLIAGVAVSLLLGALVLVLRVVTERTGELRHQALHDALTGLPNRALITDRVEQLLTRNRRHGTTGAVLFIDLDDFKNVNDSLGHQVGDQLLVAVAARLTTTLRDVDTIGRMGGDEFVVLIDEARFDFAPELVAERLLEVMRQAFILDGAAMPLIVNTSIGIAVGDRPTVGELLRDADVALYEAKAKGKNCHATFNSKMQTDIAQRIELEFDLRSALDANQFHLVYQPIYNLDDLTIVGVEALLRWKHPTRGLMQPDEFIAIMEQTGQIREVGTWVLHHACQQMADWHARGDTLDISVNISGRQLDNDDIIQHIAEALTASGLNPTSLIVEITETALMHDTTDTARRLHAIKALGVRIAVDDFGTGYSSLAYLQQFPVDCLKIDRSFTNAISTSPESRAVISTLVQLAKDLGLNTLAEGIETTSQLDHLRSEHVHEAQGFLLSRPLDPHTLETQLLQPIRTTTPTTN
jgi:diguanylate cyclase (GGDEF)-like protein